MESGERACANWAQSERDEKNRTMSDVRMEFESLQSKHKKLAKECKYLGKRNGYRPRSWNQCAHENMGYGGITRNTDCELANCPLITEVEI